MELSLCHSEPGDVQMVEKTESLGPTMFSAALGSPIRRTFLVDLDESVRCNTFSQSKTQKFSPSQPNTNTNTKTMTVSRITQYKDDIVNRIGGESQYEMTILEFCDAISHDEVLRRFYGNFPMTSLQLLQRETFDWVFGKFPTIDEQEQAEMRIRLLHYRLLDDGLSAQHFESISKHFVEALRQSWVDEKVITVAVGHLQSLRRLLNPAQEQHIGISNAGAVGSHQWDDDEEDDDGTVSSFFSVESVEVASVPASPMVVPLSTEGLKKNVLRRRSSTKNKLASLFQNLTSNNNRTTRRGASLASSSSR